MFDVFSIISKGFSGLTSAKSSVVGQTVPNTPNMIGKAGGNMNAYAATTTPSIELKSGIGKNGVNLSSGGAAATHYGDVIGQEKKSIFSKDWMDKAQAAMDDTTNAQKDEPQAPQVGAATPVHYQNLGQMGGGEVAAKAPILGVNAFLAQKQQKQYSSNDFKNSQMGG